MIGIPLLQLLAVILTICIAIVPLWYPRYSCYKRHAEKGIEKLDSIDLSEIKQDNDSKVHSQRTLTPSDSGFSEVSRAIENNTWIVRKPSKILLVVEGSLGTAQVGGLGVSSGLQAKVLVEYADETQDVVVDSPAVEVEKVTDLIEVKRWVENEANRRSHYITTLLAFAWGTLYLFIILG